MTDFVNRDNTIPRDIIEEMRESYLNYSMSVIVSRALPDVRDGLKPVHRRILYGMSEIGSQWNSPYKKWAFKGHIHKSGHGDLIQSNRILFSLKIGSYRNLFHTN